MNKTKKSLTQKVFHIAISVIIFTSVVYFIMAFFSGSLWESGWISDVGSIGEVVAAIVAAVMIIYQLEQEKDIEKEENKIHEANFILQYNQIFLENEKMQEVQNMLTNHYMKTEFLTEQMVINNLQQFINYLVYLEGLAPLILNNVINLENIDDLFAYRYFIAMNNPVVQKISLYAYPQHYRGCYKIYRIWRNYRVTKYCDNRNEKYSELIPLCESELDQLDKYVQYGELVEYNNFKIKSLDDYKELKSSYLYSVAKLLYDSNINIYKRMFENRVNALELISCALRYDNAPLFRRSNVLVIEQKDVIIGVSLFVKEKDNNLDEQVRIWLEKNMNKRIEWDEEINDYIQYLKEGRYYLTIDNTCSRNIYTKYTEILGKMTDKEIGNVIRIS